MTALIAMVLRPAMKTRTPVMQEQPLPVMTDCFAPVWKFVTRTLTPVIQPEILAQAPSATPARKIATAVSTR
jgi:hypothetical protein